jgi:beta-lactamase class A
MPSRHRDNGERSAGDPLGKRVRYSESDLVEYSRVTGERNGLDGGVTVAQLCDAAVRFSDNTAANLLLRELGGPEAVNRFHRSLGDRTRLDWWETELNSANRGRRRTRPDLPGHWRGRRCASPSATPWSRPGGGG